MITCDELNRHCNLHQDTLRGLDAIDMRVFCDTYEAEKNRVLTSTRFLPTTKGDYYVALAALVTD